jgi:RNA polymerase sigma factor (TIGR02999 family)
MSEITLLLAAAARHEGFASEELLPLVYDELRRLATSYVAGEAAGPTLQATALVHEAWLRLVNSEDRTWQNRTHFFRAAAHAMRRILVDRARQKLSLKRGGEFLLVPVEGTEIEAAAIDDRILLVDQSLERMEKEDPESARVIVLKFFGGLTNREVAEILGLSERSVERQWAYAKASLFAMVKQEQ